MIKLSPFQQSLLVLLCSTLGFALWSYRLGQDASWDVRNYHYYNPYALLNDRLAFDIAPAQLQTYLNPAIDIIPYWLIQSLPPYLVGVILGAWHGLNLWLLYELGSELFVRASLSRPRLWALFAALVGVTGAATRTEVGTSFHDLTVSVFILASIWLYVRSWPNDKQEEMSPNLNPLLLMALSGFCLGLGTGLKLTMATYALSIGVVVLGKDVLSERRFLAVICFTLASLFGLLVSAGPWMYHLWEAYGNPLFPMFNELFQSPYYPLQSAADKRFLPNSALAALSFPLRFNLTEHAGCELPFRDIRVSLMYVLTLAWLVLFFSWFFSRKIRQGNIINDEVSGLVTGFWLLLFLWVSYLLWLKLFAVYRYLIVTEFIVPIAIITVFAGLMANQSIKIIVVLILIVSTVYAKPASFGRIPWSDAYFNVMLPKFNWNSQTVVLLSSDNAISYVIPAFPEFVRFVRVDGNFLNTRQDTALTREISSVVSKPQYNFYLLTMKPELTAGLESVNHWLTDGVAVADNCQPIRSRLDEDIVICPITIQRD